MPDLQEILDSGQLNGAVFGEEVTIRGIPIQNLTSVIDARVINIELRLADGIGLPGVDGSSAKNNSVFWNTDIDRVCWKSPGGLVFRFNMRLI